MTTMDALRVLRRMSCNEIPPRATTRPKFRGKFVVPCSRHASNKVPISHVHIELLISTLDLAVDPVEDVQIRGEIKLALTHEDELFCRRNHRRRSGRRRCVKREPKMESKREKRQHTKGHVRRRQCNNEPPVIDKA
jgi:hypothetical protein